MMLSLREKLSIVKDFQAIHFLWGRTSSKELFFFRLLGKKVILHFIGSDVSMVSRSKTKQLKNRLYSFIGIKIITVHQNLSDELSGYKISAPVVPFFNRKPAKCNKDLPEKFSILVYMPEGKEEFYGLNYILEAAKQYPEVPFKIFPNSKNFNYDNIIPHKFVEHHRMPEFISAHSLFIRIPKHDGLPNTIIEALMCGRQVIWTKPNPHCLYIKNKEELISGIGSFYKKCEINKAGQEYVLENYSTDKLKKYTMNYGTEK